MSVTRSEQELLRWLRSAVADLLDLDPDTVDPDRALTELGISSRDAVGLVGELEDYLDRDLDATLVWKTPTITALARHLAGGGDQPARESETEPEPAHAASAPAEPGQPVTGTAADPIVIVGLGCRLPGESTGPDAFWDLLKSGRDAVGEVPAGRWEDFTSPSASDQQAVARTNRSGGYLGDVSGFDAEYFGISPREAELMDPQQRMLLEVAIEALTHAGIAPDGLRGSATGVYVGMSTNEYSHLAAADLARVDAWTATGSAFSIAANRISYLLDLRGPSLTLDTACSSSLVAVHQAKAALAAGEIDTALVAGVNLLLSPAVTITFDQAGALAPEGGSKPFSADADGIARAEGCGVVVLKRLSTALADGDTPLAVVRGSGVNSDGRSNGLTAPNPQAQEALLREVYAAAGIAPAHVDYIEAHGTGTLLGDPIEAGALGAALGEGRPADRPLLLGSVKSNLGHLESAAGMAGLIKVVLGLQQDVIPASLKYSAPNPHIRFDDWRLQVVTQARSWPRYGGTAIAGVSGFGFGGTNAHVVIEEYVAAAPAAELDGPDDEAPVALALSAGTDERVRAQAGALAGWLEAAGAEVPLRDVAHTLARRRGRGAVNAVLAGRGREAVIDALRRHAQSKEQPKSATALPAVPRTVRLAPGQPATDRAVWVFSGWGSQWAGMGRQLLADEPVFAHLIDELDPLVQQEAGFSLRAAIEGSVPVRGVAAIQIALFGLQVALAELWRSYGAEPAAVLGHSMGEVAAAVVAGGLSRADGVRVITQRSTLLEKLERTGSGAMAVVDLDAPELERLGTRFGDVFVCVYGSPSQLTVGSADAEQLGELVKYVESLGRNAFPLKVRGAAHSPMVEPILGELAEALAGITPMTPTVPVYSTALADARTTPVFDVDYWLTNIRRPVRFSQAVAAAAQDGHAAYLEISPHPVALHAVKAGAGSRIGPDLLALPTLRRDADDTVTFRAHALALHQAGFALDLAALVPPARQADLPGPVWQHRSFWVESVISQVPAAAVDGHPLLGVHVELPEGGRHLWRADAGTARLPWLNDHQVYGVPVLPVAGYAEMALAAGREILSAHGAPEDVVLTGLELLELMTLGEHTDVTTSLTTQADGSARVEIFARPPGSPASTAMSRHALATVRRQPAVSLDPAGAADAPDLVIDLTAAEEGRPVDLYATMKAAGHEYGPSFVGVSEARLSGSGVATARVELPDVVAHHIGYTVHPVLLDIALQSIVVSALSLLEGGDVGEFAQNGETFLPVGVGRVRVFGDPGRGGLATATVQRQEDGLSGSVRVVDDEGRLLIEVQDVQLRRIGSDEIRTPLPDLLFETVWEPVELPSGGSGGTGGGQAGRWLLVDPLISERGDGAGRLVAALAAAGQEVEPVALGALAAAASPSSGRPAPRGVLLLAPTLNADEDAVGGEPGARAGFRLAELGYSMAEAVAGSGLELVIVTVDGLSTRPGELGPGMLARES